MRTRVDKRSWRQWLEVYVEHCRARRLSYTAIWQARKYVPLFFAHVGKNDVRSVTDADLISYVNAVKVARRLLDGETISASTQAVRVQAVKTFFVFLERRGALLWNPAQNIPSLKPSRRILPVLTREEALRLMSAPSAWTVIGQRDRAILETLYGTGVRAGELTRLDLTDVDVAGGLLVVRNGKGRKDRAVPLPRAARAAIETYLKQSRPELVRNLRQSRLFVSQQATAFTQPALRYIVRRRARQAGIARQISPHILRHTYATHLLDGGADVRHVQVLLGHADVTTTTIYAHTSTKALERLLKRHPRHRRSG